MKAGQSLGATCRRSSLIPNRRWFAGQLILGLSKCRRCTTVIFLLDISKVELWSRTMHNVATAQAPCSVSLRTPTAPREYGAPPLPPPPPPITFPCPGRQPPLTPNP